MKLRLLWSLLATLPVVAAATGGSSGNANITEVIVDPLDQVIGIEGSWLNPDSCSGGSGIAIIQMSVTNYKDELAAALTAYSTGQTVNLRFNGCISSPWGNVPVVAWLAVT